MIYRSIFIIAAISLMALACNTSDEMRPISLVTLSGKISGDGIDVSNIIVRMGTRSYTTGIDGTYSFKDLAPGSYVIAPSRGDLKFMPDTITVSVDNHDLKDQNFIAYRVSSSKLTISGKVTGGGIDLSNIVITAGAYTTVTNASGNYVLPEIPSGPYTITASRSDLRFIPQGREIVLNNQDLVDQDFAAFTTVEMTNIPSGSFLMGSDRGEANERSVHSVSLKGFYIGKYEVTQKQWLTVMSTNNSRYVGDNKPVETLSWYDAVEFCNKLSSSEGLALAYSINYSGSDTSVICNFNTNGYRLPTEAEWEYACRAGTSTDRYSGNMSSRATNFFDELNLDSIAWYNTKGTFDSTAGTHPVGLKRPNAFGLYDMQGNVTEWCWDYWSNGYTTTPQNNPTGAVSSTSRALRGGSWYDKAYEVRSSFRRAYLPTYKFGGVGFRVARSIP